MTNELTTTSILSLFETDKPQRESFVLDLVGRIEDGQIDPLLAHLQVKCMEDIIKLLNSNTAYKAILLDAAEKMGQKTFEFHNAKFETKEVGVKYDFTKCNDVEWERLNSELAGLSDRLKEREKFLKTLPGKGIELLNKDTGEVETVYPPAKSSTTSVAVTLK